MTISSITENPAVKAWLLLHQVVNSMEKCEEREFARIGLTFQQFSVLSAIKYLRPPVKQADVAGWLDRNANTITMIVDRMEKDGLVNRSRDLRDRRAQRLALTPKGEQMFRKAVRLSTKLPEEIMPCLSEEQRNALSSMLETLRQKTFEKRGIRLRS